MSCKLKVYAGPALYVPEQLMKREVTRTMCSMCATMRTTPHCHMCGTKTVEIKQSETAPFSYTDVLGDDPKLWMPEGLPYLMPTIKTPRDFSKVPVHVDIKLMDDDKNWFEDAFYVEIDKVRAAVNKAMVVWVVASWWS